MVEVTFEIDEGILEIAKKKAKKDGTTIEELVVNFLTEYSKSNFNLKEFLEKTNYACMKTYNREELNER